MLNWILRHPRFSLAVAIVVGLVGTVDAVLSLSDRWKDVDLTSGIAIVGSVLDFGRIIAGPLALILAVLLFLRLRTGTVGGEHITFSDEAVAEVYHPTPAEKALQERVASLEKDLEESRQREGGLRGYPPTVTVAPKDPKWDQGDQLMFEGLALLDEIRKGGDRQQQTLAWLADVKEFLRAHNPTAWSMFDAPTGLLPFRGSGHPKAMVDLATDVDRALYLIRVTNPRRFGRACLAVARAKVGDE
jgi:hypothetical protein